MRANELVWENDEDTDMVKRKAVRMMLSVLQQYKDKKWLQILKPNPMAPKVELSFAIDEKINGLFSSYPSAEMTITHAFISINVFAEVVYFISIKNWEEWTAFDNWLYNVEHGTPLKTSKVKEHIRHALLQSRYFDADEINDLYILGVNKSHINVSFPSLKADLRAISDAMVKIHDMLYRHNIDDKFNYFELARSKFGI